MLVRANMRVCDSLLVRYPSRMTDSSESQLQAKLQQYQKAIEQEYNVIKEATASGEAPVVAEAARNLLITRAADAAKTIAWLAENATSEATRFQASKYILDNCLGKDALAPPVDPLQALISQLSGKPPATEAEINDSPLPLPLPLPPDTSKNLHSKEHPRLQ